MGRLFLDLANALLILLVKNQDCNLPRDALNDDRPDTSDESGYTGNVSLSVQ